MPKIKRGTNEIKVSSVKSKLGVKDPSISELKRLAKT